MALNQVTSQETIPPVSMAAGLAAQAVQAGAQTGQHPAAMATGQHPQYTSGQHDAMATGQHSQYTTGQHAAMATGQHPQYTTGQHAAQSTGQPDASGQFSTQTTSGSRYEAVEAHGDTSNQTATSDVPILDRNMFLQQQETAAESSDNDESQDVSNDEDGSKK